MVELENPFSWFTDDPWILLITTIGLLIMTGLAVFEGIKIIRDYHNRPQIQLKAIKNYDNLKDERNVSFWIYVHNVGNGVLSQCKVRIRITDHSGNIDLIDKTGKKYQEEFIPILWEEDKKTPIDSIDLYPAKSEYGKFKLPLNVRFPTKKSEYDFVNDEGFSIKFEDPVKISWKNPESTKNTLKVIGKAFTFYSVFSIHINSMEKSFEKKFRVVIPINLMGLLKDEYVVFEEKKLSTFFGDAYYSFMSLFHKYGDED